MWEAAIIDGDGMALPVKSRINEKNINILIIDFFV